VRKRTKNIRLGCTHDLEPCHLGTCRSKLHSIGRFNIHLSTQISQTAWIFLLSLNHTCCNFLCFRSLRTVQGWPNILSLLQSQHLTTEEAQLASLSPDGHSTKPRKFTTSQPHQADRITYIIQEVDEMVLLTTNANTKSQNKSKYRAASTRRGPS